MMKVMCSTLALGLCVASLCVGSFAAADVTGTTVTMKPTTVVGTHRRPTVVIEVVRAKPEIKLKDLQDPEVEKIVRAAVTAPF